MGGRGATEGEDGCPGVAVPHPQRGPESSKGLGPEGPAPGPPGFARGPGEAAWLGAGQVWV